jgi:hypothetical protein
MDIKIMLSWDVVQCSVVDRYQQFRGACCVLLQGGKATVAADISVPIYPAVSQD